MPIGPYRLSCTVQVPPSNQNRTKAFAPFPWMGHINVGVRRKLHFHFRFRNFDQQDLGAPSPVLVAPIVIPKPQVYRLDGGSIKQGKEVRRVRCSDNRIVRHYFLKDGESLLIYTENLAPYTCTSSTNCFFILRPKPSSHCSSLKPDLCHIPRAAPEKTAVTRTSGNKGIAQCAAQLKPEFTTPHIRVRVSSRPRPPIKSRSSRFYFATSSDISDSNSGSRSTLPVEGGCGRAGRFVGSRGRLGSGGKTET